MSIALLCTMYFRYLKFDQTIFYDKLGVASDAKMWNVSLWNPQCGYLTMGAFCADHTDLICSCALLAFPHSAVLRI